MVGSRYHLRIEVLAKQNKKCVVCWWDNDSHDKMCPFCRMELWKQLTSVSEKEAKICELQSGYQIGNWMYLNMIGNRNPIVTDSSFFDAQFAKPAFC